MLAKEKQVHTCVMSDSFENPLPKLRTRVGPLRLPPNKFAAMNDLFNRSAISMHIDPSSG